MSEERTLLVDASVFITLADISAVEYLRDLDGKLAIPHQVEEEITSEPAATRLESARETWLRDAIPLGNADGWSDCLETAAGHLGRSGAHREWTGDVALLGAALHREDSVVLSDDKPLRQTCKALSIPASGSIGVLIRAVERGDLDADEARAKLEAMDEVGARLSASLYRKAERMIDEAATE